MFERPVYKLQVHTIDLQAITFAAVAQNPRVYRPQDLLTASQNLEISWQGTKPIISVIELVRYLTCSFFVLAHRTGLYNRQRALWESLAKVTTVEACQATQGLIHRSLLPTFYLALLDCKGRPLVLACLDEFPSNETNEKYFGKLLAQFCRKAGKITGLAGLFLCRPAPFPEAVVRRVAKLTNACDPVGRYDSLLPEPLSIPINLLEINSSGSPSEKIAQESWGIRLVHPDLNTAKRRSSWA